MLIIALATPLEDTFGYCPRLWEVPLQATPSPALSAAHHTEASIVPNVARAVLGLLRDRNLSPERICRGLGFSYHDVLNLGFRLSYRQTKSLIVRARAALQDPAFGIATGARQTPLAWGLPGLAMLTCQTLGEAISYGIEHQADAGALLEHEASVIGNEFVMEVRAKYFDQEIEPVLVEDSFSSAIAIGRYLVGSEFRPKRVDLVYPRTNYADAYFGYFRCPIRFSAGANRLICAASWLDAKLPGYDEISCRPLRAQLDAALMRPRHRNDLVESLMSRLRATLDEQQALNEVALQFNMSERTLRRRLATLGVSYRQLLDEIRFERASDLLTRVGMSVGEVAQAIGFADARSFRRAFKRWSGTLPSEWGSETLQRRLMLK